MGVLTLDLREKKLGLSVDNRIALDGSGVPFEPTRVILNVDRNFCRFLLELHSRWVLKKSIGHIVGDIFFQYHVHVCIDECVPHIVGLMALLGTVIADRINGDFVRGYGWVDYVVKDGKRVVKISALEPDTPEGNVILEFTESTEANKIINYIAWLYEFYNGKVTIPPLEECYGIVRFLLGD